MTEAGAIGRGHRAGRFAPVFAALLAVFLQAFVVQTHIHAFGIAAPAIERSVDGAEDSHVASAEHERACVVCQALLSSGRALLPSAAEVAPALAVVADATLPALAQAPHVVSHSWRSRAPPLSL